MCQLIIISGPSGAGKSTVVRQLLRECDLPLELSVSVTTRPQRKGETDGQDYIFVDDQRSWKAWHGPRAEVSCPPAGNHADLR